MSFTVQTILRGEIPGSGLMADRRLYLTADRQRVVEEGSPEAAFLLAGEGGQITKADANRLTLAVVEGRIVQQAAEPEPPVKALATPANKMVAKRADKRSAWK